MCGIGLRMCDHCVHKFEYVSNPYFRDYCDAFPTGKGIPFQWWNHLKQFEHPEDVECANGIHFQKKSMKTIKAG